MKFNNPYWSPATKIQMLEQWVLVHSFLYYEADDPIIQDYQFDKNAHQLAKAIKRYPESARKTKYFYCFEDFDGSTGHHLYGLLTKEHKRYIMNLAYHVLDMIRKSTKN